MLVALIAAASASPLDRIDWAAAGEEATRTLSAYLRVDTTNPPGNEEAAADFLGEFLAREGIASEKVVHAPGRASLIARLDGDDAEKPLCLMHHSDVAGAEPDRWPADRGPLSGFVDADGTIWGRGALDMKGLGVVELLTVAWLKRLAVPLRRDVVFLAVADEEVASTGMLALAAQWDRIGCSHVLNEGGLGVKDLLFPGQTVYGISVAEKGTLWARMVAEGAAGHGSRPDPDYAPMRLARALDRLAAYDPEPRVHGSLVQLFRNVSDTRRGLVRYALRHPRMLFGRLMALPSGRALLTDTITVTGYGGGTEPNVAPTEAWATLDCRLLPGTTPEQMLATLRALVPEPWIRFDVIDQSLARESPVDDPFYRALAARVVEGKPHAVAGPAISPGFSDSNILRPLGVRAYGLAPFEVTIEEAETMHGHGERISSDDLRDGLRVVLAAVLDVTTTTSPPAR
ncbi:MAG: M20/M25/M40 family metallo-hydrolase [Myxococcota bacterium]